MLTFPKNERLCSHILIRDLLQKGNSFYLYPFRCVWMETPERSVTLQIAFSVPKRKLKFAHQRNTVKRRLRNSYRLNKSAILDVLKTQNRSLICLLVYSESKILPYSLLDEKINLVIQRIQEQLFVTLDHHSKETDTK